jgi:hypothetical protein
MPDVDVLRELSGQFHRPGFDDLVAVSRQRRRRSVQAGAVAGVAAVVLLVGVTALGVGDGRRSPDPAPSPSETPTSIDGWTPEKVRAAGDVLVDRFGPAPSGLDAELYCVGEQGCDDFPPDLPGRTGHLALELTRDGRSVLFDVQGRPWAQYYGEDSILVQDGFDRSTRFRLLYANGTELTLRVVSDPAPAVPGPDVVLVQALDRARDFQVGPEGPGIEPYLVDEGAGTLQPLDVPVEIKEWGPNVDEFLWGSNDCRAIWQQPDGSWDVHAVDCPAHGWTSVPVDYWSYLDEWVEPGRMLLLDRNSDGNPLAVHTSLDRGATWERVEVDFSGYDGTIAQSGLAIAGALRPLG